MSTVLIAGGTGLIGTRLSELLEDRGYAVLHLSRKQNLSARFPAYRWDITKQEIEEEAIKKADYIINLAGAGVADKPWTSARKEIIIKSRTEGARLIKSALSANGHSIKAYIAASAVGFYGNRGDQLMDEQAKAGTGFLSESTILWEEASKEVGSLGMRTVLIRTGIVLSTKGGALAKMLLPLNFLVSTYFGNGKQWYSWIHIDDICGVFIRALEDASMEGIYNGVAPNPARNKELARLLAKANPMPALVLPAPAFILKLIFGEMSHAILDSTKVSADRLRDSGFEFLHPDLLAALIDLLKRKI